MTFTLNSTKGTLRSILLITEAYLRPASETIIVGYTQHSEEQPLYTRHFSSEPSHRDYAFAYHPKTMDTQVNAALQVKSAI